MLNAMSQGNDGSMTTIHALQRRGAMLKMAAYAAQSPEHLTLEDTGLLIAGAIHFVIQLAWDTGGTRCVSSIREVIDADGRQVVSATRSGLPARTGAPSRRSRSAPPPWRNWKPPATGPDRGRRHERRAGGDPRRPGRAGRDPRLHRAAPGRRARAEPAAAPARGPGPAGGDPAPRRRDRPRRRGRRGGHPVARRGGAGRAGGLVPAPHAGTGPPARPRRGADRGDRQLDRDAAGHDLRRGRAGAGHPGRRAGRPRAGPRARRAAGRADPPRASGCPPRCARSPPRPPTPPPTSSSRRCCWAPSSRPATWPSCWAAWPTRPASTR